MLSSFVASFAVCAVNLGTRVISIADEWMNYINYTIIYHDIWIFSV